MVLIVSRIEFWLVPAWFCLGEYFPTAAQRNEDLCSESEDEYWCKWLASTKLSSVEL